MQVGVYSLLTGERVSSGVLVPSGKKWEVNDIIEGFIDETEQFIESYFGQTENFRERIVDFDMMLEEMRFILKRIKKGLPLR